MEEPIIISNKSYNDDRGYFKELYNKKSTTLAHYNFVQDNISYSKKGIIRGLHYQFKKSQTKLISVLFGEIFDVMVDLRTNSKNFKKVYLFNLNSYDKSQLLVPRGFAHGFQCLSKYSLIHYKCDNFYDPKDQGGLIYNDKLLNIKWPLKKIIISKKDNNLPTLDKIKDFF